ncbi:ribonuclease kappa-B-like [Brevipalpus obovatus]|uniref:ribonuclease kappa-B-like n=1 Tax=Brevipalpus obovatus TaxID=246614 RepID=UPI003D9FAACA
MPLCGPKLSICCTLLSVWGIIMLSILGLLLKYQSIAFIEDLGIKETREDKAHPHKSMAELLKEGGEKFDTAALNCWIAAGLYGATFFVSVFQFYRNMKSSSSR